MPYSRKYIAGDRLVDCDVCGLTYRRSQMRKGVSTKQKGLYVCPSDYDQKHPNDELVPHRSEGKLVRIT